MGIGLGVLFPCSRCISLAGTFQSSIWQSMDDCDMSNKVFTSFKVVGILWSFDDSGFAYFSYMRFFLNLCSMFVCILLLLVLLQFGPIRRRPILPCLLDVVAMRTS